ncbi:MAG TPA: type II secretion system F family protein [Candidatus Limnocylindrales bacterium]|nr:type II secretion system F family protein [Candidatus Limnocylindrales bacterium]
MGGALALSLALWCGLRAIGSTTMPRIIGRRSLIRVSTMSPLEWRMYQERQRSIYERWARPLLLLWADRLRLRPAHLDPRLLEQAGPGGGRLLGTEVQAWRVAGAAGGVLTGLTLAALAPTSIVLVPLLAWAGYLAPIRLAIRRVRCRQAAMRRELPDLLGVIRAFHRAGMPLERTLHLLARQRGTFPVLGTELETALGEYGTGEPLDVALNRMASRTGIPEVSLAVGSLAEGKRLGAALDHVLKDHEVAARAAQRNQATAEAARVGTKLLAILSVIYLPEFVLLIVVPLFLGIIQRAFG